MEFELRTKQTFAELKIETGNATFKEDLAEYDSKRKGWFVDDSTIEKFITLTFELSRFNCVNDVELVKKIAENFLNSTEQSELIEHLTNL